MSRIPKIGSKAPTGNKDLKENKMDMATKKTSSNIAFKRPSDDLLCATEKRPRTNFSSTVRNKVVSSVQASDLQKNKLATEQKFKRVALQPIPDTGLVRSSMPAVSTTKLKIPGKPKRAAWDLKGRIQDMEECFKASQFKNNTLEQELEAYNQRIAALETANSRLHKDVEIKSVQSEEATSQIHKLEVKLKQMTEEFESLSQEKEREVHKAQLLNQELTNLKMNYENLKISYQQEVSVLTSSITSLNCMKSGIQAQLDAAQSLNAQLKALCEEKDSKIENLLQQISDMDSKIRHEETMRRMLHNTIQELKGNIRVYCRLRPSLPEELKNGMNIANIVAVSDKTIELQQLPEVGLNESGGKANPKYEFSFDCFFPPSASQEQVFNEISQLVQSALDGYNVCIFAYGQTGSGKTFTMEGPSDIVDFIANKNNPNLGMIPRSVQHIFSTIAEREPKGWKYKVQTLFLEIYNERIQDLLNAQSGNPKCEIIKSSNKGNDCIISNVTPVDVSSEEQMKIRGENSITSEKCDVLEDKSVQASCATTSLSYSDDRHCLENLSLDLRKLLDDDSDSDVQLKCGDCTISAHRVILGVRSEVFRTMLQSDMVEGRKGSVDIVDMEFDVLKIFIRYLYTGVLPELTKDTATPLYETGDKYHVEALKRRCSDFLVKNLTHENACGILAMADAHSDKDLKDRVMPYVLDEKIPKNDDEWTKFCDDHPKLAIEVLRQAYNHSFSSE